MAPKSNSTWKNCKWITVGKNQKSRKKDGGWTSSWNYNESQGDWACAGCDTFEEGAKDTYQGNYANEKWCRLCKTHKGSCCHKLMSERAEMI